jgi:hypothetical protein
MKLLRLLSVAETESDYVAQFQEPIDIQPNSKIALQQVSFNLDPQFISLSTDNSQFYLLSDRFPLITNPYGLITIPLGNYNIQDFTTALIQSLNAGLLSPTLDNAFIPNTPAETTMDMTAYVDKDNLLNIEYAIESVVRDQGDQMKLEGITTNEDIPTGYFKTDTYPSEWGCVYSIKPFSSGQGYIETTVIGQDDDYDGVCLGVFDLTADLLVDNPDISPDKYTFCLYTEDGNYWVKSLDDEEIDTGVAVLQSDKIFMTQGRIEEAGQQSSGITFYRQVDNGDGTYQPPEQIHHFIYAFDEILHAGLSLNNNGVASGFAFSVSAFSSSNDQGVSRHDTIADIEKHTYIRKDGDNLGASATDTFFLRFTEGAKTILGFSSLTTNRLTGLTGNWTGNINIYNLAIPSALVVEMPNLPLLSYDSYLHRRRPILAVIPSKDLEVNNDTITYTPNYPVFIDINNKYQELLNSIRVRLISTNNLPLKIKPLYGCDLSVLLD